MNQRSRIKGSLYSNVAEGSEAGSGEHCQRHNGQRREDAAPPRNLAIKYTIGDEAQYDEGWDERSRRARGAG